MVYTTWLRDDPMKCPVCNKIYSRAGWLEKHVAQCRGSQPSSALTMGGINPPNPSLPRLVPTASDWTWASSFPVSDVIGRRLPRLYRKIPFALRVEAQRAYSLSFWRLREDSGDVEAQMIFLIFPCRYLALLLRGGVAGHHVTRQRISRFLGGD